MENKEKVFVDGLRFERPREGSPDFVKGRIGIEVEKLMAWLTAHKAETNKGWLNADLLQSKDGTKLYFQLNTWKPQEKPAQTADDLYKSLDVPDGDIKF